MIPQPDNTRPVDGSDHRTQAMTGAATYLDAVAGESDAGYQFKLDINEADCLKRAQEAASQASTYVQTAVRAQWARSYKAFRNEHFDGSKYHAAEYRGRSKYFRPKTRIAVLKKMAMAAQALYSTSDVVSVAAQDESDDYQVAAASLKQQILNYRMSRISRRNGLRWFLTAMGAVQTALLTGLIVSKQYWTYREDDPRSVHPSRRTGKPPVIEDRPEIQLIPPENCLFDPNAEWTNPAQTSQYLILRFPMSVDEAWNMVKSGSQAGDMRFKPNLKREDIAARMQTAGPQDATSTRVAREGGRDPKQMASNNYGRVWVYEVFLRIGDLDVVFWTLDNQIVISEIVPVRQAYPALSGERPVTIGYGSIEAFKSTPMSPVESWQQMQMETNDQANLRLDHMKNVVTPAAKVVRGKSVDLQQVQARGPNRVVMVGDPSDVEYWQPQDLPQSAFVENNMLTGDFDSLAGVFDAGSVSSNRQLGETVGGMRLLAHSTNPVNDFDLNVLVETWAEPVLWQVMKLEEMYETDATVLAVCGQKARLWERFGINEVTDELLAMESSVTIKLGVGSSNLPQEKIQKLQMAWATAQGILGPYVEAGAIQAPKPKPKEIIETIFGAAGFQDAGDRFFEDLDAPMQPPQPQGDPGKAMDAQAKMAQVQAQREGKQLDYTAKMAALKQKREEAMARVNTEHMRALAEIGRAMMDNEHHEGMQARDHVHDLHRGEIERNHAMMRDSINAERAAAQGQFESGQQPQ